MEKVFTWPTLGRSMAGTRGLVAGIGVVMAVAGVVVAGYVDKISGIAMIAVGGFLLSLVVTRSHE